MMQVSNSLTFIIKWSFTSHVASVNWHRSLSVLRAHNEKTRHFIPNSIKLVIKYLLFWLFSWRKRHMDFSRFKGKCIYWVDVKQIETVVKIYFLVTQFTCLKPCHKAVFIFFSLIVLKS